MARIDVGTVLYAGRCGIKTRTIRGKCWRKTRKYIVRIHGEHQLKLGMFVCGAHLRILEQ